MTNTKDIPLKSIKKPSSDSDAVRFTGKALRGSERIYNKKHFWKQQTEFRSQNENETFKLNSKIRRTVISIAHDIVETCIASIPAPDFWLL